MTTWRFAFRFPDDERQGKSPIIPRESCRFLLCTITASSGLLLGTVILMQVLHLPLKA